MPGIERNAQSNSFSCRSRRIGHLSVVAAANEPGQLVAWRQVQAASNGDDG
jgi:hypothetical protein